MKKLKSSISLLIVLSLIVSTAIYLSQVRVSPVNAIYVPTLSVNFPNNTNSSIGEYAPGSNFTVQITIANCPNQVFGYQFRLRYKPSVLNAKYISHPVGRNAFFPPITNPPASGSYLFANETNNDLGYAFYAVVLSPDFTLGKTATTPKTLASITFNDTGWGAAILDLCDTKLVGSQGIDIAHGASDGYFSNIGFVPIASFTFTPETPENKETVTFDASGSLSLPTVPIVSYQWNFGDGTNASGVNATHSYAKAKNYTVTLTVTNNASLSNSASVTITVIPPTANLVRKGAWPEHYNYSIASDEDSWQTLYGMVENFKNESVNVKIVFTVYTETGEIYLWPFTTPEATLAPNEIQTLTYNLYKPPQGTYSVEARAIYWNPTIGNWVNGAVTKGFSFTVIP